MTSSFVTRKGGAAQGPASGPDRRRRVRHRVHTPGYTSLTKTVSRVLPDLHELVDISEDGLCFRNSSQLPAGKSLDLNLDLSENPSVIAVSAKVIWSDSSGRTGVAFRKMPPERLAQLREWLLVNTLVACTHFTALQTFTTDVPRFEEDTGFAGPPDYTVVLAAVSAVGKEVETLGIDVDAALSLIATRAQAITRSTGAAIALASGDCMICRATSGRDAPGVGVYVDTSSGFTAECVRTGHLLYCVDAETDAYVDRDTCRALGIRSIMAAPIWRRGIVAGLLEVFAPLPQAFSEGDRIALIRLAEMAGAVVNRAIHAMATSADVDTPPDPTTEAPGADERKPSVATTLRRTLLSFVVVGILLLLGLFLTPQVRESAPETPTISQGVQTNPAPSANSSGSADSILQLAQSGDAAAQFSMGARYAAGAEVKQDYSEAARWFSMAAEHGNVAAQSTLAAYYWAGTGVAKDLRKAYFWAVLAQAGGDEPSRLRASVLASLLTRPDLVAEQQRANYWLKQHGLGTTNPDDFQ